MKVWLLTSGEYSGRRTYGVFSGLDKLEAGKAKLGDRVEDWNDPEEFEVDEILRMEVGPIVTVKIDCETGEFLADSIRTRAELRLPGRCEVHCWDDWYGHRGRWIIQVASPVSLDHARKVAIEERQKWLRERAVTSAETERDGRTGADTNSGHTRGPRPAP